MISGQTVIWRVLRIVLSIGKVGFGSDLLLLLIGSNRQLELINKLAEIIRRVRDYILVYR